MWPCVILFRHFFALVKSGKGKDEVGAYYFQTRSDLQTPYIPGLTGGKWEDWRKEWVIATTEANERLDMPTGGPASDRQSWRAKPSLPPARRSLALVVAITHSLRHSSHFPPTSPGMYGVRMSLHVWK